MLTPQEIQEKKFSKAVFGGYDMGEVDSFLDELFADYESLFKDAAVLKSKLKTLAEKVEEYRSVDEEMRRTLASAKRSAEEMKSEAEKYAAETRAEADRYAAEVKEAASKEAEQLEASVRTESENAVSRARAEAEEKIGDIRFRIEQEQKRLEEARAESRRFAADAVALNRRQLEILRKLMEMSPAPAKREHEEPEAAAAWSETAVPTSPAVQERPEEEERITGRHAEEDAAGAAATAAEAKNSGSMNEPTKRLPIRDDQPTKRFDAVRRVDVGGETVEIGDMSGEQQEEDILRELFGGDRKNGE